MFKKKKVFYFGKSNLNPFSRPTQEHFAFLKQSQESAHIMHTYTHREKGEEERREGALSVWMEINVHCRNKCAQRKKPSHPH